MLSWGSNDVFCWGSSDVLSWGSSDVLSWGSSDVLFCGPYRTLGRHTCLSVYLEKCKKRTLLNCIKVCLYALMAVTRPH